MKRFVFPILLVLMCMVFLSLYLGELSLLKGDENYYFSSARRMIWGGDWITPRYHHHIRFEKPVLYYWIVAVFFKIFGVSWFSARFTSVLFGSLTILLTYLMALRLLTKRAAMLSPIILATSFLFFWYARIAVIDITFLFLTTAAFFLFLKGEREDKKNYVILSSIPLGLSVLAKGPLGLLIFSLVILSYLIITRKLRTLNAPGLILWISLILLISLPWPIAMYKIHGAEYISHLWEVEAVDKAIGSIANLGKINNYIWFFVKYLFYYVPVVLFTFAPWSLFLPFASKTVVANTREDRVFIMSWFWCVFILFTVMSFKHTHYMLLLSPPLAMVVANFFVNAKNDLIAKKGPIILATGAVVVFLLLVGVILPGVDCGTLKNFSLKLASEMKEQDEEIGIASKGFNLKKLGLHLNNLVSNAEELSGDDLAQYRMVNKDYLEAFLESKRRVYCLITKKDYLNSIPKRSRDKFYILDKSLMWKKFDIKNYLLLVTKRSWNALKEEGYLISNRK